MIGIPLLLKPNSVTVYMMHLKGDIGKKLIQNLNEIYIGQRNIG